MCISAGEIYISRREMKFMCGVYLFLSQAVTFFLGGSVFVFRGVGAVASSHFLPINLLLFPLCITFAPQK